MKNESNLKIKIKNKSKLKSKLKMMQKMIRKFFFFFFLRDKVYFTNKKLSEKISKDHSKILMTIDNQDSLAIRKDRG